MEYKHIHWFHYLAAAFCALGAFATWSRWCWLPIGIDAAPKALGLHFFEGWLVFLLLGFTAGLQMIRTPENRRINGLSAIICLLAMVVCLVFVDRFGRKEMCNALWISFFSAGIAFVFLAVLWKRSPVKIKQEYNLKN